ncbi:MAG: Nre family DNA repair protein [Methanobacteriota archaeon]
MAGPEDGIRASPAEVRREVACRVCRGDIKRCRLAICPYLERVRAWFETRRDLQSANLFGASPPGAFVGSWGYPKVLAGPLVPPVRDEDTSILDASENWLAYEVPQLLRFRLTLVRGKAARRVAEARSPDPILSTVQEAAMASRPIDTEMWLGKKPVLVSPFGARSPPSGPSADIRKVELASNPSVPRRVDDVVGDTDLKAGDAVEDLYRHGIAQSHITRLFSVGLLGTKDRRRLVPTEWSITAIDDILAKGLVDRVRGYPWISDYEVCSATGVANTVAILLFPQAFMFEGLEAWNLASNPTPIHDHEFAKGRTTYPDRIAGAYHATRLPVLEHLAARRRQAGAVVCMEVYDDWVPLGVWRYRELARAALATPRATFPTLDEAEADLGRRLRLPLENWWRASVLRAYLRGQRRITSFDREAM